MEQQIYTEFNKELVCYGCGKTYFDRNLRKESKTNFCCKDCMDNYRKIELPLEVIEEYKGGISIYKLSRKYKVEQKKVSEFLKKNSVETGFVGEIKDKYVLNKEEIENLYLIKKLHISTIAEIFGCDRKVITNFMEKNKIQKRQIDNRVKDETWLKEAYLNKRLAMLQISKILNCNEKTVWYYLKKFNIPRRERMELRKGLKTPIEQRNKVKEHHWTRSSKRQEIIKKSNTPEKVRNRVKHLCLRPTSFEKKICELCIENDLTFVYTGDGRFIVGCKSPDFVDEKNKIIIEVFSDYFKIKMHGSVENYIKTRREYFANYGYKTVFITEKDVKAENWKEICLNKIREVVYEEI